MRWPWQKAPERRSYTSDILAAVFQHATQTANDAGKTAGVEFAAGYVSRQLASAEVQGPPWAQRMLTPMVLSQMARGLIRRGSTLWAIEAEMLTEAAYWNFVAGATADKSGWRCNVTDSGPHGTRHRTLPFDRLVFVAWSNDPAIPWAPGGPMQNASLLATLAGNAAEALSHDAAAQVGSVIEIPSDGRSADQYEGTKEALKTAKGRIYFQETLKTGDRNTDPDSSFKQKRFGPMPDANLVEASQQAFLHTLASCGIAPDLAQHGANSQGQREAARRTHLNLILPLSKLLEHELREKLDDSIRLRHEGYFGDLQGRASALKATVAATKEAKEAGLDLSAIRETMGL